MTTSEKFNVNIIGNGSPTIVMVHGYGSNQRAWNKQIEFFSSVCRIIVFDHIGSDQADVGDIRPDIYSDFSFHRENLISIYDSLNLKNTIYIGHSVSAMLGLDAYLLRPELFAKFIFINGSPCYINDDNYYGGFSRTDINQLYSKMAEDFFSWAVGFGKAVSANSEIPTLGEYFARELSSMQPVIAQSVAKAIFELDFRDKLGKVDIPVLILQAKNDPAVPIQVAEYLFHHIRNSQLTLLDAEGHLPHISAPDQVNKAIRDFIDVAPI